MTEFSEISDEQIDVRLDVRPAQEFESYPLRERLGSFSWPRAVVSGLIVAGLTFMAAEGIVYRFKPELVGDPVVLMGSTFLGLAAGILAGTCSGYVGNDIGGYRNS